MSPAEEHDSTAETSEGRSLSRELSRKRQRPANRNKTLSRNDTNKCSHNLLQSGGHNGRHVCKGGLSVLFMALLRCPTTLASQTGGGGGGGGFSGFFGPLRPSQGQGEQNEPASLESQEWVEVTYEIQSSHGRTPFTPYGSAARHFVQTPDPKEPVRALAMDLDEEDGATVANYVATVLQKLANANELFLGEKARKDTVFHSASMPTVAVAEFVERVAKNVDCPNLCFLLALLYMDRLALPSSELRLYVTPLTAHRLFAASLIIAIKFLEEDPPSLSSERFYEHMHTVTGLAVSELKHLEHHMLQALSMNAMVTAAEMKRYMVDFTPKVDDVVPYVDQPYFGPPPFPFQ